MSDLEQYNAIIKIFREHWNQAFAGKSLVYIKRKTGLCNAFQVRWYSVIDYQYRMRTVCKVMNRLGLIFAFINKLNRKCELLTSDADMIMLFLKEQRNKRLHKSMLKISTRMSRRKNCTLLTMVRAFNELGYFVRIGTASHG